MKKLNKKTMFFHLFANQIISDLEDMLSNIQKKVFKIKYTNSKGDSAFGQLIWDKTNPSLYSFIIKLGDQTTTIINDQKKIIMNVERPNQKDQIKPKDITDNPLSSIFKKNVQFVEHSDSQVQAQSQDLGNDAYRVILHKFNDPECKKDRLILEYIKKDSNIQLKTWVTVTDGKAITIDFL